MFFYFFGAVVPRLSWERLGMWTTLKIHNWLGGSRLTHGSLDPRESTPQIAFQSVQLFLQGSHWRPTDRPCCMCNSRLKWCALLCSPVMCLQLTDGVLVFWRCWLGSRKGIWPVKKLSGHCWHSYLSGARCRLAYSPFDATATHCLLLQ